LLDNNPCELKPFIEGVFGEDEKTSSPTGFTECG